jgi:antitoxin VapB
MALYIKDPAVDEMAARLAAVRGQTKTQAVRAALQSALEHEPAAPSLVDVGVEFARALRARGDSAVAATADKAFIDSLYEAP